MHNFAQGLPNKDATQFYVEVEAEPPPENRPSQDLVVTCIIKKKH